MNNKNPTNYEEFESDLLQDSEIRQEFESLKPKYAKIQSLIKRRNQPCVSSEEQ